MDIGYGLWEQPRLLQLADLVGHHGLSFIIVLLNATAALEVWRLAGRERLSALGPPAP